MCVFLQAEEQWADEVQLTDRITPDASNQPDFETQEQELHGSFAPDDADDDSQDGESTENSAENSDND